MIELPERVREPQRELTAIRRTSRCTLREPPIRRVVDAERLK